MPKEDRIEKYEQVAARMAWRYLGPIPKNEDGDTNWMCNNRHVIRMTYNQVKRMRNCPTCVDLGTNNK
jgi:hypothetical protein